MRTYANIIDDVVYEKMDTDADITTLFHPDLVWLDVTPITPQPEVGWRYDGTEFAPPLEVAPVVVVPSVVTAAQGGIALIQAGLMTAVQAVVDAADTPAEVKWAWQRAQDWQRDSPALAYLAQRAGISKKQMDDLFIAAPLIQA